MDDPGYYINYHDGLPQYPKSNTSLGSSSSLGGGGLGPPSSNKLPAEFPSGKASQMMMEPAAIFFASKNETFRLGDNFKTFHKRIKSRVHKVIQWVSSTNFIVFSLIPSETLLLF